VVRRHSLPPCVGPRTAEIEQRIGRPVSLKVEARGIRTALPRY
jgi:hypothetical protein